VPDFDAMNLKITGDIRDLSNKLGSGTGKIRTFAQDAGKHASAIGRSFAEMSSRISGSLKGAGTAMSGAGRSMATAGAAITGAYGLMLKDFASFEDGLKNIEILLGGDEQAMAAIEEQIRSLAVTTGVSRNDMVKAFFDVKSATDTTSEAMGIFEAAVKLAEAGGAGLGDSTAGLLTLMENYGDTLNGASDAADLLFKTQVKARASVAELAATSGMFIPTAKEMGVTAEDAMAAFAKMTLGIGNVNVASTSMNAILNALKSPTEDLIDQMKEWYGLTPQQAVAQGKLIEIMGKLGEVEAERASKLIPNIRASKGLAAITNDLNGVMQTAIELKTRAGIVDENFAIQQDRLTAAYGHSKESLRELKDAVIMPLVPLMKELGTEIIPAMTVGIRDWIEENKELAEGIVRWTAGIGAGGVAGGAFLIVAGQLVFALGALWPAITAIAGAIFGGGGLLAAITAIVPATVGAGASAAVLGVTLGALIATIAIGVTAIYKIAEALYYWRKAENDLAAATAERTQQQKANTKRLVDANNEYAKSLQGVSEEDKKRIELLNTKIEKEQKYREEIEARIKTGEMDEAQGKKLRNMTIDRLNQYADESMALENELKAKYKTIEADKQKTKEIDIGSKAQGILNKKMNEAALSSEAFSKAQEILKKRLEDGVESQDSYTRKLKELTDLTKTSADATSAVAKARRANTSAIDGETAALQRQHGMLVSKAGEGGGSKFLRSTPRSAASTVLSTASSVRSAASATSGSLHGASTDDDTTFSSSGFGSMTSEWPTGLGTLQRGTPFVPETGMYQLHRGESVTPRGKNEGQGGSGEVTIVNVIDPSMVNGLLDKNLIINTINADIIKRGVTRRVVKGVSR